MTTRGGSHSAASTRAWSSSSNPGTSHVASVAKSAKGIARADAHYPAIARRHSLHVLMANCVGPCDDFEAVGGSAIWNRRGDLIARLPASGEGALLLDTATDETSTIAG